MLAPDVILHGDGGGKAQAIGKPVAGRQRVAQLLAGLFRRGRPLGVFLRLAWVNGHPGAVMYDAEGLVLSVIELDAGPDEEGAGAVQAIHAVVNPDKLGHLGPVSDVARLPGTDDLPARAGVSSAPRQAGQKYIQPTYRGRPGGMPAGARGCLDAHIVSAHTEGNPMQQGFRVVWDT
jgi:hypothetical protein